MPSTERLVYAAVNEETGLIKIGISVFPANRAKQLSALVSAPVSILGAAAGSFADEKAVHKKLKDSLVKSEWFKPTDDVLAFVETLPPYNGEKADTVLPNVIYKQRLMNALRIAAHQEGVSLEDIAKESRFTERMAEYLERNILPTAYVAFSFHRALKRITSRHSMPTRKELGLYL